MRSAHIVALLQSLSAELVDAQTRHLPLRSALLLLAILGLRLGGQFFFCNVFKSHLAKTQPSCGGGFAMHLFDSNQMLFLIARAILLTWSGLTFLITGTTRTEIERLSLQDADPQAILFTQPSSALVRAMAGGGAVVLQTRLLTQ
jgi:hypothetical protein